jgi:hypothetical protein
MQFGAPLEKNSYAVLRRLEHDAQTSDNERYN